MRLTNHRQEGEAVGLLPTPREWSSRGRLAMNVEGRIGREDAWTLLAVAYLAWDGAGTEPSSVALLARLALRAAPGEGPALRASLVRLVESGLVVESNGRLRAATPVAAFLRARSHRRGVWHDHRDLVDLLGLD